MMSNRKRNSPRRTARASSEQWREAVERLIYCLRTCGGHWLSIGERISALCLHHHEMAPQVRGFAVPMLEFRELSTEERKLKAIRRELARIRNHPKADLTKLRQRQLNGAWRDAHLQTRQRLNAIPAEMKKKVKALKTLKKAIDIAPSSGWITIAEAERLSGINRGQISKAVDAKEIRSNELRGKGKRRIDSADFNRWNLDRLKRAEKGESDERVKGLFDNAATGGTRNNR